VQRLCMGLPVSPYLMFPAKLEWLTREAVNACVADVNVRDVTYYQMFPGPSTWGRHLLRAQLCNVTFRTPTCGMLYT
jgi:hypothetical protein